ncbi:MAG: heparinase II/III family protein [Rhodobacteraceae bacterium]|nr:heparinase II/III family protein [Paracoccaceae bacterium]
MDDQALARPALRTRVALAQNRVLNRLYARLGGLARPVTALITQPEPKTIGSLVRGRQLIEGRFMFAGQLVRAPDASIWQLDSPDAGFETQIQGFVWLDDLAAVGDRSARELAQGWLIEWIDLYGRGKGPGWLPELAGRRMIRWINHALFLIKDMDRDQTDRFYRNLARQARFLAKRWRSAPMGLPRFEALCGLLYAGLALEGQQKVVTSTARRLAQECARRIDQSGAIPSRNPEELMEIFSLLTWAASALGEGGHMPGAAHMQAIMRIAPCLRALQHADGSLARFHGGGRGVAGRLDQALALSGIRAGPRSGLAMGFARLSAGRSSIIVDADIPPRGDDALTAHASTLAFELTSGRRPIIVNCGSGVEFGTAWRRAARATPSHSTLAVDRYSSSRFARAHAGVIHERLVDGPDQVRVQQYSGHEGSAFMASHNGYAKTHGLHHMRRLDLSLDGRELRGRDTLGALSEKDRIRFEELQKREGGDGIRFDIRFHIHPDIEAEIGLGGTAVSLALKSGEVWVFRHHSDASVALDASVYLERGRLEIRATKQIVLSDIVLDYSSQVSWSLTRAQDGNKHIRDVEPDDN